MPDNPYDVLIIGAGHNGLTAAAFLARAGKRVAVLEQRDLIGGFCTTEETVPEAPGFKMNRFAADVVLGNIPPTVEDDLDLGREGLRWVAPDPFYSYLSPSGESFAFWRDVKRTAEEIKRFSPRDAEAYPRFTEIMVDLWRTVAPYLQGHPTRIAPRDLATILGRAGRSRRNVMAGVRIMLSSPAAVIDEWFESEQVRAALACYSVSTMASLDEPGSGIVLSMLAVQHHWGVRRPVGGVGAYADALHACVLRHGGQVRACAPVASVDLRDGRAGGVTLTSGERIRADTVIATVDPWTLAHKLLPDGALPDQTYRELRGISMLRNGISTLKGDVALSGRPRLVCGREEELLGTVILMASSLEAVRASTAAALQGRLPTEIPLWLATPSVYDRTLVPEGSSGEALYLYLPAVPYELAEGHWRTEAAPHLDRSIDALGDYMPGVRDLLIGAHATSPYDLEQISGLHKGSLFHVDPNLAQFGPWRPTPSLGGYRTPIPGLLHSGAGNHPMGALCGWSGRTVARTLLSRRNRRKGRVNV